MYDVRSQQALRGATQNTGGRKQYGRFAGRSQAGSNTPAKKATCEVCYGDTQQEYYNTGKHTLNHYRPLRHWPAGCTGLQHQPAHKAFVCARVCACEHVCVCVCVCVCARECYCVRRLRHQPTHKTCVCVCICMCERESVCACVCVRMCRRRRSALTPLPRITVQMERRPHPPTPTTHPPNNPPTHHPPTHRVRAVEFFPVSQAPL